MAQLKGIAIAPEIMAPIETREAADVAVIPASAEMPRQKAPPSGLHLFEDDWQDAIAEVGGSALDWTARRANLLVTGMRSPQHEGGIFTIGDVRLEVVMETDPCEVMENTRLACARH